MLYSLFVYLAPLNKGMIFEPRDFFQLLSFDYQYAKTIYSYFIFVIRCFFMRTKIFRVIYPGRNYPETDG